MRTATTTHTRRPRDNSTAQREPGIASGTLPVDAASRGAANSIGAVGCGATQPGDAACRHAGLAGVDAACRGAATSDGAASRHTAKVMVATGRDATKTSDAASRSAVQPRPGTAGRIGDVAQHESATPNDAASRCTVQARGESDGFIKVNPPT